MAVRTKPVRIFEADHSPLRLIADLHGLTPAEVFHVAIAEYLHAHREEFAELFGRAQTAIAGGRVEDLSQLLQPGANSLVEQLMRDVAQVSGATEQPQQ